MNTTYPLIHLFGKTFNVPSYQRGYRWTKIEVNELLNDLYEFLRNKQNGRFYCLQPIVLKKIGENEYDLIDGQQRLTTLYLILSFLEDSRFEDNYNQELFKLNYTTRDNCRQFLEEKRFANGIDDTNIDYHYMCLAYEAITNWFAGQPGAKSKMTALLMDSDEDENRNVKLIWYEIGPEENPIEAFVRLNIGKIPLTDAELIKALLLQSDKYSDSKRDTIRRRLFEIASEWDQIEYNLQKEEVWYFINDRPKDTPTHIDFIFDLIADQENQFEERPEKHATYHIISKYLSDVLAKNKTTMNGDAGMLHAVELFWEKVTNYYNYIMEWYGERDLFHYIVYLINEKGKGNIDVLIEASKVMTKTEFKVYLRKQIKDGLDYRRTRKNRYGKQIPVTFETLVYETEEGRNDKAQILKILLLHNIITTQNSEKELARFPFNLYKKVGAKKRWSLEHIHARKIEPITDREKQNLWMNDHMISLRSIDSENHKSLIKQLQNTVNMEKIEQELFDQLVEKVAKVYQRATELDEKEVHLIGNMCLIDAELNSHLNRSMFDVKREKIKQREIDGCYIPICSRNAFLKAYSVYPKNTAFWDRKDREAYISHMKTTLNPFIQDDWK
ncbi:DUF262 domain-containing protein [Mucilaginibacter lutimaris]|uniref:DUF262 domain-containing protein n=1 Tax=Mucilaginibacter lutimaris TaxID=931629 RepID=A0ABW2ZE42_9SPHI